MSRPTENQRTSQSPFAPDPGGAAGTQPSFSSSNLSDLASRLVTGNRPAGAASAQAASQPLTDPSHLFRGQGGPGPQGALRPRTGSPRGSTCLYLDHRWPGLTRGVCSYCASQPCPEHSRRAAPRSPVGAASQASLARTIPSSLPAGAWPRCVSAPGRIRLIHHHPSASPTARAAARQSRATESVGRVEPCSRARPTSRIIWGCCLNWQVSGPGPGPPCMASR